jgi:uncharacterized protein with ParB-like and HNH nuclease domain
MTITPNKLSISQLFAISNEQFVVPAYQRRYAWGNNQTNALFEDIDILQENDGHLFGMLILHATLHHGGLNCPEIVDGQQRITTLTLLLKAIQSRYSDLGREDKVLEIGKMLICKGYDDVERNKLVLGDLDNLDYARIMSQRDLEAIENKNLYEAYNSYNQLLSFFDLGSLNKFYFKLTNVAILIRLDVGLAKDAYKLFETINNRGLRLSPTDIIKNFLLGHAAKIEDQISGTLAEVKRLWTEIIKDLDGLDADDFFRQYMCSALQRKVSMNKLVAEFKDYYFKNVKMTKLLGEFAYYSFDNDQEEEEGFDADDVNHDDRGGLLDGKWTITQFLAEIAKSSRTYKAISLEQVLNIRINRRVKNLNRILSKPSYIFLMNFLRSEYDINTQDEVLKMIETFMLRRHICEMRTGEHDDVFSKLNKHIGTENIVEEIKDSLMDYYPKDQVFSLNFPQHQFKGKLIDRAKYVLEMMEYNKTGNTSEFSINQGSEVHLEHIVPQTIDTKKSQEEYGDWISYLGENALALHKRYVNKIGNMTLLAGPLNISGSNNPFETKKEKYTLSNILLTKELKNYDEFRFEQIDNRGKELAELALQIWTL